MEAGVVLGEMTLLLGDRPNVTIVAESDVTVYVIRHGFPATSRDLPRPPATSHDLPQPPRYEIRHAALVEAIHHEPLLSGRVFKLMAVIISERIAATSKRARDEVVSHKTKPAGGHAKATLTAKDIDAKREEFGLPPTEALLLATKAQASMNPP